MNAIALSGNEHEVYECPACKSHLRQEDRAHAPRPHPCTSAAAGPLFSITFWLCSGNFDVSGAFSSIGLSDRVKLDSTLGSAELKFGATSTASNPTTLLSSSGARLFTLSSGGPAASRTVRACSLHSILHVGEIRCRGGRRTIPTRGETDTHDAIGYHEPRLLVKRIICPLC